VQTLEQQKSQCGEGLMNVSQPWLVPLSTLESCARQ